jgi:hypothetical protein
MTLAYVGSVGGKAGFALAAVVTRVVDAGGMGPAEVRVELALIHIGAVVAIASVALFARALKAPHGVLASGILVAGARLLAFIIICNAGRKHVSGFADPKLKLI